MVLSGENTNTATYQESKHAVILRSLPVATSSDTEFQTIETPQYITEW